MNRHQLREQVVFVIYQHLLLKMDLMDRFENRFANEEVDPFAVSLVQDIYKNESEYIDRIQPLLKDWAFDRLSYIDQAILLLALGEMSVGLNDKAVVIDEAINLSKDYSDETSYKYINAVLDQL